MYIFIFTEMVSGYFHCFQAKAKTELFKHTKQVAEFCNRFGFRMKTLYVDAGKVETSKTFKADCARINGVEHRGVEVHAAPPGRQQQNFVERDI